MKNYRAPECCRTCKFGHTIDKKLYCTIDGPAPENPDSRDLRIHFMATDVWPTQDSPFIKAFIEACAAWEAWAEGHSVDEYGLCDEYQPQQMGIRE